MLLSFQGSQEKVSSLCEENFKTEHSGGCEICQSLYIFAPTSTSISIETFVTSGKIDIAHSNPLAYFTSVDKRVWLLL
eukprot:m.21911 g.21911  ORF g.21911 m.21911 type:complete len:78 (+) comp12568_c0_seq1:49-282(+)